MLLYIIRHGDPDYENDSLTALGQRQAEALVPRMVRSKIDEIYSSPMGRAIKTAEPTAKALGLPITVENFMSERLACDNFQGKDGFAFIYNREILKENKSYVYGRDGYDGYYKDDDRAERGYEELCLASDAFIEKLGYRRTGNGNAYLPINHTEKKAAVFCHEGFGVHWLSRLTNFPFQVFTATVDISHTGVSIVEFTPEKDGLVYPKLLVLSDLSHIYCTDIPYTYCSKIEI